MLSRERADHNLAIERALHETCSSLRSQNIERRGDVRVKHRYLIILH